ncbi:MAG: branched-chain amino acid ABC transporter permease [Chloroflexi bacterium]|nr:MAG: branched-chain amino acid ABC transporter permease [Chloroflexota bacterium]
MTRLRLPGSGRFRLAVTALFLLFVLVIPQLAALQENLNPDYSARFTVFLATSAIVLALWAASYNLMLGYAGMVSFAHAAYYGIGAYTVGYLYSRFHLSAPLGLVAVPLVGAAFGFVTGLVALRAVRLYFSLLTLAISQVLFAIAFSWQPLGGDNGIHAITIPDALSDRTTMYYFVLGITIVCLLVMWTITRAPFGAAMLAIRENRERARSIGINVKAYELAIYTLGAMFGAIAGGLFAVFQQEAYPEMLYWTANAQPVVVALLGGTGTFLGPALGAFVYTLLDNWITSQLPNLAAGLGGPDIRNQVAQLFDLILGVIVVTIVLVTRGFVLATGGRSCQPPSRARARRSRTSRSPSSPKSRRCRGTSAPSAGSRCSPSRGSANHLAACERFTRSTSASTRATGTRSSVPTGPESRPSSISSPGASSPTGGRSSSATGTSRASRPT